MGVKSTERYDHFLLIKECAHKYDKVSYVLYTVSVTIIKLRVEPSTSTRVNSMCKFRIATKIVTLKLILS